MTGTTKSPDSEVILSNGSDIAAMFKIKIDKSLKENLMNSLDSIGRARKLLLSTSTALGFFEYLSKDGISFDNINANFDHNEIVGLVGEILVSELSIQRGLLPLFLKYQATATSKSRGIDLMFITSESLPELRVMEAKHLHDSLKGKSQRIATTSILARFREGIDEFESEKTAVNIAYVIMRLISSAQNNRGTGVVDSELENKIKFLISKLKKEDYSMEVSACVDMTYCENDALDGTVRLESDKSITGNHKLMLNLLEVEMLEEFTKEALSKYAGEN